MFNTFKEAVDKQMTFMSGYELLVTSVPKDIRWETYLGSFPPDSNLIYKERTEHDCQSCKQFIRAAGAIVAIINGKLVSIWDIDIDGPYADVAKAMSDLVKSYPISNKFCHYDKHLGTNQTHQHVGDQVLTWDHFYFKLPAKYVKPKAAIDTYLGTERTKKETFNRALTEITTEAVETVLELIAQKSLYKGDEYRKTVLDFFGFKADWNILTEDSEKELFIWKSKPAPAIAGIRNSSIGSLLLNLSRGLELDAAVTQFENMVAPENYKRTTALITKGMITKAQAQVKDLGLEDALERRFAVTSDLAITDILYANRDAKKAMNVFEELSNNVADKKPNLDKIEEISIDTFMSEIAPKADAIEIMVENSHTNNLVSLVAPAKEDAPKLFKWGNPFSWSYNGEVTDSMAQRVKGLGGKIDGILRCSIQWNEDGNDDHNDLDVHCKMPGAHIFYSHQYDPTSHGKLDVDITQPGSQTKDGTAVENITWSDIKRMPDGDYAFHVHNYSGKNTDGFRAEIEIDGQLHEFSYDKGVTKDVPIAVVTLKNGKFTIKEKLTSVATSKNIWGVKTHTYQNVSVIMQSPNHWGDQAIGNKHWFFMLTDCVNPTSARGFYNEFLRDELREHRKVFEVLSSKFKTPVTTEQLSGVGFSSTKRNSVLCKVSGAFSRIVKITF